MDCFYAAVETRENPRLIGHPVAVGGKPGQRGVVAACNYEARAFGVHSAMPMSIALRQCPKLIYLPVHMDLYRQVSTQIHQIFRDYTPLIEPLSLDEAYLDVTGVELCQGSASLMARDIRQRIFNETGLTASAGIAANKMLAKIASDWNKPNGQTLVAPDQVDDFIKDLPVKKINGVGIVTTKKMHQLGIHTCVDLQKLNDLQLQQHFGRFGQRLFELCRGIDPRPVNNDRITKSLSIEDTYTEDLPDLKACIEALSPLFKGLLQRHERAKEKALLRAQQHQRPPQSMQIKTLVLKMRFSNFVTTTAQTNGIDINLDSYKLLCQRAYSRGQRPVRLLGLGMAFQPTPPDALRL